MSTLTVDLPEDLPADEARLHLSMRLFEIGRLSLGQAARMAGCSKRAHIDLLGEHEIPVIDYPSEELDEELSAF